MPWKSIGFLAWSAMSFRAIWVWVWVDPEKHQQDRRKIVKKIVIVMKNRQNTFYVSIY